MQNTFAAIKWLNFWRAAILLGLKMHRFSVVVLCISASLFSMLLNKHKVLIFASFLG